MGAAERICVVANSATEVRSFSRTPGALYLPSAEICRPARMDPSDKLTPHPARYPDRIEVRVGGPELLRGTSVPSTLSCPSLLVQAAVVPVVEVGVYSQG